MVSDIEKICAMRLRELRRRRDMTLDQIEIASHGQIKAVVLGSYERGTRAISLARLTQLADFYEVPLDYFLGRADTNRTPSNWSFDLRVLRRSTGALSEIVLLKIWLQHLAQLRQDWAGEFLTIRASDGELIEKLLSKPEESIFDRLQECGVILKAKN